MIRRHHDDARAFEEAWSGRAPRDGEIAALVACAEQMCAAAVEPSEDFRAGLRYRLMREAADVMVAPSSLATVSPIRKEPATRPVRRRLAGATAAVLGSVGLVSLVGTSAQAVPGEMLYPIKRSVENVQLALHHGDASRGEFRLELAQERLAEARQLATDDSPAADEHVRGALDDFSEQAEEGSTALLADYDASRSEESISSINDFTAAAATDLAAMSTQVPDSADASFDEAAATISELAVRAAQACNECESADIGRLAGTVASLAAQPTVGPANETESATRAEPSTKATSPSVDARATDSGPSVPDLVTTLPSSEPTTGATPKPKPNIVSTVTKPVVTVLLGDDEHVGLVPGLLRGLLGGGRK